jgi:hypothetical protein
MAVKIAVALGGCCWVLVAAGGEQRLSQSERRCHGASCVG